MKTLRLILLLAAIWFAAIHSGRTQSSNSVPLPSTVLADFQKLVTETRLAYTNAQTAAKAASAAAEQKPEDAELKQKAETAQTTLDSLRQKLTVLEQAAAALQEQGPIRPLINDLKQQRDALPIPGSETDRQHRTEIEARLAALEKADTAFRSDAKGTPSDEVCGLSKCAIVVIIVIIFVVLLIGVFWCFQNGKAESGEHAEATGRIRLAKAVTSGAMGFILLVSFVVLLFAGVNAALSPQDEKKTTIFFDMAKWVLATVLPVGWAA
jgi:hypothetical protein